MSMSFRTCGLQGRLVILSLCTAGLFAASGANCTGGTTPPPPDNLDELLAVQPDDHVEGSPDAPVTVVEYADFECPFCGRFARETLPTIRTEYIETGLVRWVFRHFPLRQIHVCAEAASRGSECAADQDMFVEFHDRLFANQSALCNADLKNHAVILGLNSTTFDTCLDSGGKADRVQRDLDSGEEAGVTATPHFFINGKSVIGFRSADQMRSELNAALAAAGS